MTAFHLNPVAAAVRASSRVALVLATVALSWGLGGVAEAKGWGAHQAQVVAPMRARPTLSGPVRTHPMMAPHLALSSSVRRMPAGIVRTQAPVYAGGYAGGRLGMGAQPRPLVLARLGGVGAQREPLRVNASMRPMPLRTQLSARSFAAMGTSSVRWPVAAGGHPVAAGTLGRNAPLARVVREGHLTVLEALQRGAARR